MNRRIKTALLGVLLFLVGSTCFAQTGNPNDARAIIKRAIGAVGIPDVETKTLHFRDVVGNVQDFQSDRTYPPYFSSQVSRDVWFDPRAGIERATAQFYFPGSGPSQPSTSISNEKLVAGVRDSKTAIIPGAQPTMRRLNAWAVLLDWQNSPDVTVVGKEVYRDYPRTVLSRKVNGLDERLYLDVKTGFPVKVDAWEAHYLWGQVHVEYIYSTWIEADGAFVPGSSFCMVDGETNMTRTTGSVEIKEKSEAPDMTLPDPPPTTANAPSSVPLFLQPLPPKTIKVSDNTYLLTNPGYTETITLVGNKVYVLDATQGEARAKQDEALIHQLFPGKHEIVVVITDLAWPHVAGIRYWVSTGATIISHRASKEFLTKVIDRKWTLAPDELEKNRGKARMKFVAVDDQYSAENGKIKLYPIDGIGSEVALMAYLPEDKFLWASDYIQSLRGPTLYASEVIAAAGRAGIQPEQAAAEHLPLTQWKTVLEAQKLKK